MPLRRVAVVVMGRFPEAGKVKTRMVGVLSAGEAAAIHGIFFRHFVGRIDRLNPAELVVCYEPVQSAKALKGLLGDYQISCLPQVEGDPGAKLASVLQWVGERHERVLVFGVDTPDVPLEFIFSAAAMGDKVPVSIGPRPHGGFWYLSLWNKVEAGALLDNIAWSSGREARQTLENAASLGYACATGEPWEEIEAIEDLERMMHRLQKSDAAADMQLLQELRKAAPGLEDALGLPTEERREFN